MLGNNHCCFFEDRVTLIVCWTPSKHLYVHGEYSVSINYCCVTIIIIIIMVVVVVVPFRVLLVRVLLRTLVTM